MYRPILGFDLMRIRDLLFAQDQHGGEIDSNPQ